MYRKVVNVLSETWISRLPGVKHVHRYISSFMNSYYAKTDRPQWISYRGNKLYADTNDHVAGIIRRQGVYEQDITDFINDQTSPGDLIIDVGAHIGHHSITMRQSIGKKGKLLLFEPNPRNAEYIEQTISENGWENVQLFRTALSDTEGIRTLKIGDQDNTGSATTRSQSQSEITSTYEVQTRCLSQFLRDRQINQVDLLKIDIEGSEYEVVTDIAPELDRIEAMVIEVHEQKLKEEELNSIFEILSKNGNLYNIGDLGTKLDSVSEIQETIVWSTDS